MRLYVPEVDELLPELLRSDARVMGATGVEVEYIRTPPSLHKFYLLIPCFDSDVEKSHQKVKKCLNSL